MSSLGLGVDVQSHHLVSSSSGLKSQCSFKNGAHFRIQIAYQHKHDKTRRISDIPNFNELAEIVNRNKSNDFKLCRCASREWQAKNTIRVTSVTYNVETKFKEERKTVYHCGNTRSYRIDTANYLYSYACVRHRWRLQLLPNYCWRCSYAEINNFTE